MPATSVYVKHKAKFITYFIYHKELHNLLYLPQGTSENIIKVESLAQLKVEG